MSKAQYENKFNTSLYANEPKDYWDKIKQITGSKNTKTDLSVEDGVVYANKLNEFYSRFDTNSTPDLNDTFQNSHFSHFTEDPPCVSTDDTRKVFSSLQLNKANGPDRISTRILKVCAAQLAIPYTIIFNQSLSLHKSPTILYGKHQR